MFMDKMRFFLALFLIISFAACTKSGKAPEAPAVPSAAEKAKTPEELVRSFVELSAAAKDPGDKQKLQNLCSGEMRGALEKMTDEGFRLAYLGNLKVTDITFVESKIDGDLAKLRYRVSVENGQGTDTTKEENEREVELVQVQGIWRMQNIRMKGSDKIAFMNGMVF
jgi:hypothetical protein